MLNNPRDEVERTIQQHSLSLRRKIPLVYLLRCFRILLKIRLLLKPINYNLFDYSCRDKQPFSTGIHWVNLIQLAKTSNLSFEKCYTELNRIYRSLRKLIFYYHVYHLLGNINKTQGSHSKI